MKTMKASVILKKFFGLKQGQILAEFLEELKALTPEDKAELASLAAVELGVEVEG